MTAAEITLGAVMCALWAVFLILSAIGIVVTHKDANHENQRRNGGRNQRLTAVTRCDRL